MKEKSGIVEKGRVKNNQLILPKEIYRLNASPIKCQ
jgi:hypothetical protein